jgi:hypothetical protein
MAGEQLKVSGWAIGDTTIRDGLVEISYFLGLSQMGFR